MQQDSIIEMMKVKTMEMIKRVNPKELNIKLKYVVEDIARMQRRTVANNWQDRMP